MIEIVETDVFSDWFRPLRDSRAKARILVRIRRMALGNLGDVAPIGEGVSELRIHYGPGYRIYLSRRGEKLVILLCGGDKRTQTKDILAAKALAKSL